MRILIILAALLLALPATANDSLRVGVPSQGFVFSPLVLGLETGAFARSGLDVERQFFSGAAKLTQALTVGATDIVLSGATDAAYSVKGSPEKLVCAIATRALNLGISVGNDIRSVADLKGKRIGVTQSGDHHLLAGAGTRPHAGLGSGRYHPHPRRRTHVLADGRPHLRPGPGHHRR